MQEIEIHVVQPEPPQTGRAGAGRARVAIICQPELRGDKYIGTRDAAARDALAHLAFVAVGGRGVDQAIATGDRRLNGGRGAGDVPPIQHAETQGRHGDAVVQGDPRAVCRHARFPGVMRHG